MEQRCSFAPLFFYMKALIQRVSYAKVEVGGKTIASIDKGLLILLGIHQKDEYQDADYLLKKITQLRIFPDAEGSMNVNVIDAKGNLLVVSQFTLYASTKKGNRPSFIQAARPEIAIPLYEYFCLEAKNLGFTDLQQGVFGADMQVSLCNDGPVTLMIDSRNKE